MKNQTEWLEVDNQGGYATGCVDLVPRRRYHGFLVAATTPPSGRMMLVNNCLFEVCVTKNSGEEYRIGLNSVAYKNGIVYPPQGKFIKHYASFPCPTWEFVLPDFAVLFKVFMTPKPSTTLMWQVRGEMVGIKKVVLEVRPLLSGRDHHALHKFNKDFSYSVQHNARGVQWQPYSGVPEIAAVTEMDYHHDPLWFYDISYSIDEFRGFEHHEDLVGIGVFSGNLYDVTHQDESDGVAITFTVPDLLKGDISPFMTPAECRKLAENLPRQSLLEHAASCYIVSKKGGNGTSIIAGYPWFNDWGRDTFISIRGLLLATERFDVAKDVFMTWARSLSNGMIPNLFPEKGQPLYNSVDAALWYIVSGYELIMIAAHKGILHVNHFITIFKEILHEVITSYGQGTRFGIEMDQSDCLLRAGISGSQVTWMDAKIGSLVVTPRIGKPVEIQSLWINALKIASELKVGDYDSTLEKAYSSFNQKFFNGQYLNDVIDVGGETGHVDDALRPNQIFAIGGLPFTVLDSKMWEAVLGVVTEELYTPHGMRTLSPKDKKYRPFYVGNPLERDMAYHQGTAWPWLTGAYIEAKVRAKIVHDNPQVESGILRMVSADYEQFDTSQVRVAAETAQDVIPYLREMLGGQVSIVNCGHISELADASPPHIKRGAPFQAWSLAEVLRVWRLVLNRPIAELSSLLKKNK